MLDGRPPSLQRSVGAAGVSLGEGARLTRLHQSGSAKAFLPQHDGEDTEIVFLNTSGGVAGGDRLSYALSVAAGVHATGTTQTAERIYRSTGAAGDIDVRIEAGPGARLCWLPQETILFDGARARRVTEIALEGDAELLTAETVILGRAAMGETVTDLSFADLRRVTRDGRPVHVEPLSLETADLARPGAAGLSAHTAMATVVLLARAAADRLSSVRALLDVEAVTAAASAWDGRLVVRLAAPSATLLRRLVARILIHLRGAPLPRVWQV